MKPAKHDLQYYIDSARSVIDAYKDRDELYAKIDKARHSILDVPAELKALPWIKNRKFATPSAQNAIQAATRTFAARPANIDIMPFTDEPESHDYAELLETAMEWDFMRQNANRSKSVLWKIVEHAMAYCAVAFQTEYLSYSLQDVDESDMRMAEIKASRTFNWIVHNPGTVYPRESEKYGLESVLKINCLSARELQYEFGENNPGVRKALKKIKSEDATGLDDEMFSLYDWTDWYDRVIWVSPTGVLNSVDKSVPDGGIEIMRQGRKETFLPWVYVDYREPLLRAVVDSGLYENIGIMRTIAYSKTIDMAAHPDMYIQTPDGTLRNVKQAGDNPSQPLVSGPGVNVQELRPPAIDPQLATMMATAEAELQTSTVAGILASVERYAGVNNFSTVHAMLDAAAQQLSLSEKVASVAIERGTYQNFQWIKFSKIPYVAYRATTKNQNLTAGQEIAVKPDKFDLRYLYIKVTLTPNTVSDKTALANNLVNWTERLGMSQEAAWDEAGKENFALNQDKKAEETLFQATIRSEAQSILNKPQIELAQAQSQIRLQEMAAQAQMQQGQQQQQAQQDQQAQMAQGLASQAPENPIGQPQSPQNVNDNTGQYAASQGIDNRGGGSATAQANPEAGPQNKMRQ